MAHKCAGSKDTEHFMLLEVLSQYDAWGTSFTISAFPVPGMERGCSCSHLQNKPGGFQLPWSRGCLCISTFGPTEDTDTNAAPQGASAGTNIPVACYEWEAACMQAHVLPQVA